MLVVALEQAVAAPLCTSRLADAGARVIKIERPEGDFARGYDRVAHGQSAYFLWLNRGKESLTLDIKDPADQALLARIIARCVRAEPGAGRRRAGRFRCRRIARPPSPADHLLDLRLRRERAVSRHEGLRHADPG
jgi:hypothetical protein